jgi:hypothetical protein
MVSKPASPHAPRPTHWLGVLCLVGLDYFSTLAYQPSIAFETTGLAAPLATIVVVVVTLLGALPLYLYVAGRSPEGQGAIGLLERTVHGWLGKLLILTLLGFAATDFVITRTLSVADAAVHLIHNPQPAWQETLDFLDHGADRARLLLPAGFWQRVLDYWNKQMVVTVLLSLLGFLFWHLFRRGITRRVLQLAVLVLGVYLALNAVLIGSGLLYLAQHPTILETWRDALITGHWYVPQPPVASGSSAALVALCLLSFPKMALGLSGFELSMVIMPLVQGDPADASGSRRGRIRNTRKMLMAAAGIMSLYLLGSALVTTTLIPPQAFVPGGPATNRALAYLAHGGALADGSSARINPLCGQLFGTVYDFSTVLILGLAGTSITLGLRDLVPQYLHRLGMELEWAHNLGAMLHVFNLINLAVTVFFRASVTAQRGAYATSVLVMLSSAGVASLLHVRQARHGLPYPRMAWVFVLITSLFGMAALATILVTPEGLAIALAFVVAIMTSSVVSRILRSTELRFQGFQFADGHSRFLWESLQYMDFPVLVPHRPGRQSLSGKEAAIRQRHRLTPDIPVVFVEVQLGDASDFYQQPFLEVSQQDGRFILRIDRCVSVAHVIAAVGLELSRFSKPPEIHFGWSDDSPLTATIRFLLFGEGNIPWLVRELICRAEPDQERQPRVIIG